MTSFYDIAFCAERRWIVEDIAYELMLLPPAMIKLRILKLASSGAIYPEEAEGLMERFKLRDDHGIS